MSHANGTRLRAWAEAWERTAAVHLLGGQSPLTERQKAVVEAMSKLASMPLPVSAIHEVAEAVLAAWEAGREAAK